MIRLAFAIGNVPFDDLRIGGDDWPNLRPNTPYGSLPILTVDGRVYAQSTAILRYAGKLAGLYPEDPEDALKVDEVLDLLTDANSALHLSLADEVAALAARERFVEKDVPALFGGLEKRLEMFSEGNGPFVLGSAISIADIALYSANVFLNSGMVRFLKMDCLQPFGRTMAVVEAVENHPGVAEWVSKNKE